MFKRLPAMLLFMLAPLLGMAQLQLFVSPNGNDADNGIANQPYASLSKALFQVRELRRLNDASIKQGVHIVLKGGVYTLNETIVIRPEDAGTKESPTIIEAAPNEQPVISGGVQINGWKRVIAPINGLPKQSLGKVWVADVPAINGNEFLFRQLWVNNVKAIRAKDTKGELMNRIISWNKKEETCFIPTPKFDLQNVVGAEMFIHQWWAIAILRIKKFEVHGDSAKLFFHQPESKIQSQHPWPAPWISKETGNSAFYLTNTIQFLDEAGEWFLDIKNRKLYYYPRSNEDLSKATIVASNLETLIKIEGTSEASVSNIHFNGISFQHTGWLSPSNQGHVPHQAGMYMTEAYKLRPAGTKENSKLDNQAWIGRPAAAVQLNYGSNMSFDNCRFEHLASMGIDGKVGVKHLKVIGNLFRDIGGTAILAGNYGDEGREIHLPYITKIEADICEQIRVEANLITNATNEDWSAVGIGFGTLRKSSILQNEIEDVSYTGISLGWGWNPVQSIADSNEIAFNKIHHYGKHNYDCAGIYTLGNQMNSFVEWNTIDSIYKAPYAHLPSHWFYLYADEGSSNITFQNNWTPTTKYLQNANGPGNVWTNNGVIAGEKVKKEAGIYEDYNYLLKYKSKSLHNLSINEEHKEVLELIVKDGKQLDVAKLKQFLVQNKMDSSAIYQWSNHYVVFDYVQDIGSFQGRLQKQFPDALVKPYHDMFYEYSKKKHCADTSTARQWDNIILTANLVADTKLQQEYLDYHATQFEKWKEVSKGFCNANFQQLLIFKNGRQLVLIISIPKGESLDKLNPKTTENNPRVSDWNKIMGKYQEGIEGTKKEETWVFLKQL